MIELDRTQSQAVELCCSSSLLTCVTGPAGTGKTTIIQEVSERLTYHGYRVALAAPTGKAAKRISEATGIKAMTIHRLLDFSSPGEVDPTTGKRSRVAFPRRHSDKPVDYDIVIVDEYAMVPTALHRQLVDALRPGAKLRCFGDINQLPPIDDGDRESPFRYLLRTKDFPTVILETLHRHDAGSSIVTNGLRILRGIIPVSDGGTFGVKVDERPLSALTKTLEFIATNHAGDRLFDSTTHQVITPQRVGKLGSFKLNQVMIDLYGAREGEPCAVEAPVWEVKRGRPPLTKLYTGQKVIVTQNIYDLRPSVNEREEPPRDDQQVFNGETGIIKDVSAGYVTIDVGDRVITIPPWLEYIDETGVTRVSDPRLHIEHAYAITTHKSQGSEYEGVVYFICAAAPFNQCRPNFYTAVTRARSQVLVVGDRRSVGMYSLRPQTVGPKR
jgi:exodeoxyribonuclease V alpha subunit